MAHRVTPMVPHPFSKGCRPENGFTVSSRCWSPHWGGLRRKKPNPPSPAGLHRGQACSLAALRCERFFLFPPSRLRIRTLQAPARVVVCGRGPAMALKPPFRAVLPSFVPAERRRQSLCVCAFFSGDAEGNLPLAANSPHCFKTS